MKIHIKNIGILKQAEFSLGDFTVICGKNNTGKTYATYALYAFLRSWPTLLRFPVNKDLIQKLLSDGGLKVALTEYAEKSNQLLEAAGKLYSTKLADCFAAPGAHFRNSEFYVQLPEIDILETEDKGNIGLEGTPVFTYSKERGSQELLVTLVASKEHEKSIDPQFVEEALGLMIRNAIFSRFFPMPIIASSERTGVAFFRKELNFARNRLLEEMGRIDRNTDPLELLSKAYQSYPQPIEDNVDFVRELEVISKRDSFIVKQHPEVLEDFSDIVGGEYAITRNDQLHFTPKGKSIRLTMDQSSSAVRSLLDIGSYLRYLAQVGHLLMVDEPELNLHPANQRRLARLFARLVNLGVKVFITTHSDYIVKELNTLIMLNHDKPHLKRISQENGYRQSELIRADQVRVYMAREELMPLEEGQKRRRRGYTLVEADIDPELGIEAPSFDETIDDMNRIQEEIVWGAE